MRIYYETKYFCKNPTLVFLLRASQSNGHKGDPQPSDVCAYEMPFKAAEDVWEENGCECQGKELVKTKITKLSLSL